MNAQERAITFACEGEELVGVVTSPSASERVGVLVISGAPQYRVGAHRQFVLLARRLAASSVAVMRFDYRGVGDSSGGVQRFEDTVPDIAAALAAFQRACPMLERIVLLGLCDGASAAALYWQATADPRVTGMALLNPWVSSDQEFAHAQIGRSFRRVLQPGFWAKLFRGEIDLAGALRSFASAVETRVRRTGEDRPQATFRERMIAAMDAFRGPVVIVLSGRDLVSAEFVALSESNPAWRAAVSRANVERCSLPEADHTFSQAQSRESAEAAIVAWLRRSVLVLLCVSMLGATESRAAERAQIELEQQQDALDLALRHHGLNARRYDVAPADARRIDALQVQQRLEQQRLEIEHWQRLRALERNAPVFDDDALRRRLYLQHDAFRQERQLQAQRFQLEQQRLMQSITRQPLQPHPAPGTLRLP